MQEDAMPERPWEIETAYRLLVLGVLALPILTICTVRFEGLWPEGRVLSLREFHLLFFGLFYFTLGLVVYLIVKGRNGARIFYLILLLLGAPPELLYIILNPGHSIVIGPLTRQLIGIFQLEIQIVAAILLFQRSSSDWFKAVERLRSKEEAPEAT
jgi:hypothetical protein